MENVFTHYWITEFGWENTIYLASDFKETEVLGYNKKDGTIFLATNEKVIKHIFKGKIIKKK